MIAILLSLPSGAVEHAATDAATRLVAAIDARLSVMPDVAAYKWINDVPIDRPDREVAVITRVTDAIDDDLRGFVARALRAQIEASKAIQRSLFARWRQSDAPTRAPDLDASRRRIDAATNAFVDALTAYRALPGAERCAVVENPPPRDAALRAFTPARRIAIEGVLPESCDRVLETSR